MRGPDRPWRALECNRTSGSHPGFSSAQNRPRRGVRAPEPPSTCRLRWTIRPAGRCWLRPAVLPQASPTREAFEQFLNEAIHAPSGARDVDLLIRTGGEQRLATSCCGSRPTLSYFTGVLWPDFTGPISLPPFRPLRVVIAVTASGGGEAIATLMQLASRPFLVIHDATPAYACETRMLIRDLAPLLGRRLSFGVVPNWYGEWPLAAHPDYCRLVMENSEELLLHGYFHRRQRGRGPTTLLTDGNDEMNGLDPEETRRTLERGQRVCTDVFGQPARGFLAPAWRRGHVRLAIGGTVGLEHVLGFFSLESRTGRVPREARTWDCGAGPGSGTSVMGRRLLHSLDRVPVLAIRDGSRSRLLADHHHDPGS